MRNSFEAYLLIVAVLCSLAGAAIIINLAIDGAVSLYLRARRRREALEDAANLLDEPIAPFTPLEPVDARVIRELRKSLPATVVCASCGTDQIDLTDDRGHCTCGAFLCSEACAQDHDMARCRQEYEEGEYWRHQYRRSSLI